MKQKAKEGMCFSFDFGLYSIHFDCTLRVGGLGGGGGERSLLDGWKSVMHGKSYVFTVRKTLFNFKKKVLGSFNKGKLSENSFNIAQTKNFN